MSVFINFLIFIWIYYTFFSCFLIKGNINPRNINLFLSADPSSFGKLFDKKSSVLSKDVVWCIFLIFFFQGKS